MQDICHYYLAYLEEEAEAAGAGANSLKEQKAVKARMVEKGLLAQRFNSKSILAGINDHSYGQDGEGEKLGGVGRKRQNTESV